MALSLKQLVFIIVVIVTIVTIILYYNDSDSNWIPLSIEIGFGIIVTLIVHNNSKKTEKNILSQIINLRNQEKMGKIKKELELLEKIFESCDSIAHILRKFGVVLTYSDYRLDALLLMNKAIQQLVELRGQIRDYKTYDYLYEYISEVKRLIKNMEIYLENVDDISKEDLLKQAEIQKDNFDSLNISLRRKHFLLKNEFEVLKDTSH